MTSWEYYIECEALFELYEDREHERECERAAYAYFEEMGEEFEGIQECDRGAYARAMAQSQAAAA